MGEPLYLFEGMGSEYVLAPVAEDFRAHGQEVAELDFFAHPDPVGFLQELRGRDVVLVSSAHPDFDRFAYQASYKDKKLILSALELMSFLKPKASYYIPHDLTTPILDEELRWLPFFDGFLSPLPNLWWLRRYVKVYETGWIRRRAVEQPYALDAGGNKYRTIFFPTFMRYHAELGVDAVRKLYDPLISAGVPIKFPVWPGTEAIEDGLSKRGARIIPARVSSYELMRQADIVISTGLSSAAVEACLLGKSTVCLKDDLLTQADRRRYLSGMYRVSFMDIPEAGRWIHDLSKGEGALPPPDADLLPPFDFNKARAVITGCGQAT